MSMRGDEALPVLVTGATGRVGRAVVDLLVDAGVPVRALAHRSEAAATLPAAVEAVRGDLTVPGSLDAALQGVGAVFLVWTVPPATAPAVVGRLAAHARRVVFLSALRLRRRVHGRMRRGRRPAPPRTTRSPRSGSERPGKVAAPQGRRP
jgi:uncharacterized protein YbjT (DUF2867 family)